MIGKRKREAPLIDLTSWGDTHSTSQNTENWIKRRKFIDQIGNQENAGNGIMDGDVDGEGNVYEEEDENSFMGSRSHEESISDTDMDSNESIEDTMSHSNIKQLKIESEKSNPISDEISHSSYSSHTSHSIHSSEECTLSDSNLDDEFEQFDSKIILDVANTDTQEDTEVYYEASSSNGDNTSLRDIEISFSELQPTFLPTGFQSRKALEAFFKGKSFAYEVIFSSKVKDWSNVTHIFVGPNEQRTGKILFGLSKCIPIVSMAEVEKLESTYEVELLSYPQIRKWQVKLERKTFFEGLTFACSKNQFSIVPKLWRTVVENMGGKWLENCNKLNMPDVMIIPKGIKSRRNQKAKFAIFTECCLANLIETLNWKQAEKDATFICNIEQIVKSEYKLQSNQEVKHEKNSNAQEAKVEELTENSKTICLPKIQNSKFGIDKLKKTKKIVKSQNTKHMKEFNAIFDEMHKSSNQSVPSIAISEIPSLMQTCKEAISVSTTVNHIISPSSSLLDTEQNEDLNESTVLPSHEIKINVTKTSDSDSESEITSSQSISDEGSEIEEYETKGKKVSLARFADHESLPSSSESSSLEIFEVKNVAASKKTLQRSMINNATRNNFIEKLKLLTPNYVNIEYLVCQYYKDTKYVKKMENIIHRLMCNKKLLESVTKEQNIESLKSFLQIPKVRRNELMYPPPSIAIPKRRGQIFSDL